MDVLNLLKSLAMTPGPSGLESDIATVVTEMWQPYTDEIRIDRVGNVIATKYGQGGDQRQRVMISAHMDEIALIVTKVETHNGYGFLRVSSVGGIDKRQLYGQRVMVHGKRNMLGVLSGLPVAMLPKKNRLKVYQFDDLIVDLGCSAETVQNNVQVGDFVTFHQSVHTLKGDIVAGKAFDNRASLVALTVALEQLSHRPHQWDVIAVASVQEEVTLLGGYTAPFAEKPDIAIALDVSFATQPAAKDSTNFDLGSGPILDIGVNVHPALFNALKKSAKELEMNVSILPHARSSGTEARAMQVARAGVPTALISLPIRYMHQVVETVHLKDVTRTGRLLTEFVTSLDDEFMGGLSKALIKGDS